MNILRKIARVLIIMLYFALFLLLFSERWFLATWDSSIEFSTVMYQIFSPLKGTGTEVMLSYISSCIYPTVILAVFFLLICWVAQRFQFTWEIRIGRKFVKVSSDSSHHQKTFFHIITGLSICVLGCLVWMQAVDMGVEDYIEQMMESTMIYEEEYVDPKNTVIFFPNGKRNLILIYLESMETTYSSVGEGGAKPVDYIPELTQLAKDNLFFSNDEDFGGASSVSGAGWTMAALLGSSTGVPYKLGIEGNSADMYERFLPGITSIGDILLENGYQNYFMCGSDIEFAGRGDFYRQHGDYALLDIKTARENGIIASDYDNGFWGMEDEKLFTYAKEELQKISANGNPFNFTLLTVDTHHPNGYVCSDCREEYQQQYANILACSSYQVSSFVEWVQGQDWYDETTIVITGDHLSMKGDFWEDIGDYDRKIYNCFINLPDGLLSARTKKRTFTILDMFPSILVAVGAEIEGDRLGLGVNLFSTEMTLPERMGMKAFDYELGLYSGYYFQQFIVGK